MPGPEEEKCIRLKIDCSPKKDGGLKATEDRQREKQDMLSRKYPVFKGTFRGGKVSTRVETQEKIYCITYHIYWNSETEGKIEKHIPKQITEGFEDKYQYIYHDKEGKEHEICTVEWFEINKVKHESKLSSIPKGYVKHESFNIKGVNQKDVYHYSDGAVVASGDAGEGGGKTIRKYVKTGGKAILIKLPEPFEYSKSYLNFKLTFENTIRKYMGRNHFAALIGALANENLIVISEGSAMKDGTCFPSVSHTNGESIDTDYYSSKVENQKIVNAMAKFGFTNILHHPNMSFKNPLPSKVILKPDTYHRAHFHFGAKDISVANINEK